MLVIGALSTPPILNYYINRSLFIKKKKCLQVVQHKIRMIFTEDSHFLLFPGLFLRKRYVKYNKG